MPAESSQERRMIQVIRPAAIAVALSAVTATFATAQRSGGTMGLPRIVTSPTIASPAVPSMGGPVLAPSRPWGYAPRSGDLPRLVTGSSRYASQPYTRWGAGAGCGYGCLHAGGGFHSKRRFGSSFVGYPFGVPLLVPYFYESSYVVYPEPAADAYAMGAESGSARAASKLIVVGGATSGGDALTVETLGDSVRLSWLGAGRPVREVKLFVADSAQRPLASRSASPSAPVATFEVVTLSAPVAFAGVSVTFADGVVSTTTVPYQQGAPGQRR